MFKITIVLTAAFLLSTGETLEKSETQILERGYTTLERCRKQLRNNEDTYRAIRQSINDLQVLAQSSSRELVRVGVRAFCLRYPS